MAVPFPATISSPYNAHPAASARCGIYYGPTPSPSFTLGIAGTATYAVRDWNGDVVSSGTVSGTTVTPTAPNGGWVYGWYRLYLWDGSGLSTGAFNFSVIRTNANFVTNPPVGTNGDNTAGNLNNDEVTRGIFAMGPQRYQIAPAVTPAVPNTVAMALTGAALNATYYLGITDANRPRPLHCAFTSQAYDVLVVNNTLSQIGMYVFAKTGSLNGSLLTVATSAGSSSGFKVVVAYNGSNRQDLRQPVEHQELLHSLGGVLLHRRLPLGRWHAQLHIGYRHRELLLQCRGQHGRSLVPDVHLVRGTHQRARYGQCGSRRHHRPGHDDVLCGGEGGSRQRHGARALPSDRQHLRDRSWHSGQRRTPGVHGTSSWASWRPTPGPLWTRCHSTPTTC